jgi:hypothetical protein
LTGRHWNIHLYPRHHHQGPTAINTSISSLFWYVILHIQMRPEYYHILWAMELTILTLF